LDAEKAGWADCCGFASKKSAKTSSVRVIGVLILVLLGMAACDSLFDWTAADAHHFLAIKPTLCKFLKNARKL